MNKVHLRAVDLSNRKECWSLQLKVNQEGDVATNEKSLLESSLNPNSKPIAIYDYLARGFASPKAPMVGFAMYEITAGVGFINKIMIDGQYQEKGYATAALKELIRRLSLSPDVEVIATSVKNANDLAISVFQKLGFKNWDVKLDDERPEEKYLILDQDS